MFIIASVLHFIYFYLYSNNPTFTAFVSHFLKKATHYIYYELHEVGHYLHKNKFIAIISDKEYHIWLQYLLLYLKAVI